MKRPLRIERLGRVSYGPAHMLQKERHHCVVEDSCDDTLFLLEHHPVITTGKNTKEDNILADSTTLKDKGVELFATGRGGDVTFHAPGQIVGYPILKLQEGEKDVRKYVWNLEEVLIRTAADFQVVAERVDGLRGIWVGTDKLAAIGVRLSRWTTMHGFAFNVSTDLSGFELIVPCGIQGRGVTSLQKLCLQLPSSEAVEERLIFHTTTIFDREGYRASPSALPMHEGC